MDSSFCDGLWSEYCEVLDNATDGCNLRRTGRPTSRHMHLYCVDPTFHAKRKLKYVLCVHQSTAFCFLCDFIRQMPLLLKTKLDKTTIWCARHSCRFTPTLGCSTCGFGIVPRCHDSLCITLMLQDHIHQFFDGTSPNLRRLLPCIASSRFSFAWGLRVLREISRRGFKIRV
jgi:hypothetical protein